jgi:xanthine dehydrogenase accessory factor
VTGVDRDQWTATADVHGPEFAELESPAPKLIMFGAVPLAAALCELAPALGWRAYVVDPRARFAVADRFPGAAGVLVAWPEEAFAAVGGIDSSTAVLMLTHDPALDDPALEIALRTPCAFVGAMGSRRTQAGRRERLRAAGLSDEEVGRLSGPIGLDTGARTAPETALAVLAEIVAVRHGRDGGRLTSGEGSIREVRS